MSSSEDKGSPIDEYTFSKPYRYVAIDKDFSFKYTKPDKFSYIGEIAYKEIRIGLFTIDKNIMDAGKLYVHDKANKLVNPDALARFLQTFRKKMGWTFMYIGLDDAKFLRKQLTHTNTNSFLKAGLVPQFYKEEGDTVQSYKKLLEGEPLSKEDIEILSPEEWYSYDTANVQIKAGMDPSNEIPLFLGRGKELLFDITDRPYTAMFNFRDPKAKTNVTHALPKDRAIHQLYDKDGEIVYLIRVSRYSVGMSRGLYYVEDVGKYCGTFYYYEPDSDVLLNMGRKGEFEIFRNKVEAALSFSKRDPEFKNGFSDPLESNMDVLNKVIKTMAEKLPTKFANSLSFNIKYALIDYWSGKSVPAWFKYNDDTYVNEWYAAEDPLDQMICTSARGLGLKVVILSNMTGGNRLVTEVLDTRLREESIRNLVFEIK